MNNKRLHSEHTTTSSSSSSAKKRKSNTQSHNEDDSNGSALVGLNSSLPLTGPSGNARSEAFANQKYFRGSIVHIRLKNFVTYADCELSPGPNLNVVIGPNGSGKSTIVCALALGLGGKPELLGRGKRMADFIKHGAKEAMTEIELFRDQYSPTLRVQLHIRKDNYTEFKVNGRKKSRKEVAELMNGLNVQVDNLCHFLPQDKVCDFAGLSHPERLKQTEKAVGPPEMLEQHMRLCDLSKELESLISGSNGVQARLQDLEEQNKAIEREVQRYRERDQILLEISHLEKKRPWLLWDQERQKAVALRDERDKIRSEVEKEKKAQEPVALQMKSLEDKLAQIDLEKRRVVEELKQVDKERRNKGNLLQKQTDAYEQKESELATLRNSAKERQQHRDKITREIASLKSQLQNSSIDISELNQSMVSCSKEIKQVDDQIADIQQNREIELKENIRSIGRTIEGLLARKHEMEDVKRQRLDAVRRAEEIGEMAYKAFVWLEKNRNMFKERVYGPVCVEVQTKDPIHAAYLEMSVAKWLSTAFVFQNDEDRQLFEKEMRKQGLRVSTTKPKSSAVSNPCDINELRKYGLEMWLSDCVEAPPSVLASLCDINFINTCAISKREVDTRDIYRASSGKVREVYTPTDRLITRCSKYGARDFSISSTPIKQRPRFFGVGVNTTEKEKIEEQLRSSVAKKEQMEKEIQILKSNLDSLASKKRLLQSQLAQLQKNKKEREGLVRAIELKNKELEAANREQDTTNQENKIKADVEQINTKRITLTFEMTALMEKLTRKALEQDVKQIERAQVAAKISHLQAICFNYSQKLNQLEKDLHRHNQRFDEAMKMVKELNRKAQEIAPMDQWTQVFQKLPNTLEELDKELESQRARADLIAQSNPAVIRQYEEREQQIQELKEKLENENEMVESKKKEVETLKERWLSGLKDLVKRINDSFSKHFQRFGRGEVKLAESEDFSKYALEIYVSYRDNIEPSLLDPNTQSGGERSVATMIYLLSLHEITKCPFRLVDEINQGMDPENERKVFEIMQTIACRPNCPQYFLITPKLLPRLNIVVQSKLTFLCICNGPWANHHQQSQPQQMPLMH